MYHALFSNNMYMYDSSLNYLPDKKNLYQIIAWNYHLRWVWGRPVSELGKHLLSAITQDLVWTFESSCLSVTYRESLCIMIVYKCLIIELIITSKAFFFFVQILSMHVKFHNLVTIYCNFNFSLYKVLTYTVLESWINTIEEGNVLSLEPSFLVKQKHDIRAKVKTS